MTLEQIVAQHPCPIIRAKIMENLNEPPYIGKIVDIEDVMVVAMKYWGETKEGVDFWYAATSSITSSYSDLKHLDKSIPPAPKWLPIDRDNPPSGNVAAMKLGVSKVHAGRLYKDEDESYLDIDDITELRGLTHYIPLSDLLNLPIAE